jgi:hypothetical protein
VIRNIQFTGKSAEGLTKLRSIATLDVGNETAETLYYFRIMNCARDEHVSTLIRLEFDTLKENGYERIIGIRDVYPTAPEMETELRKRAYMILPKNGVSIRIVFAVREVEAWFIAEENHYARLDKRLSIDTANKVIRYEIPGFDVCVDSTEVIEHPTKTLQQIYNTVGNRGYQKTKKQVEAIMRSLDFSNMFSAVRNRNASLDELLTCIETVFNERKANIWN